jgi:hypothetical protein
MLVDTIAMVVVRAHLQILDGIAVCVILISVRIAVIDIEERL